MLDFLLGVIQEFFKLIFVLLFKWLGVVVALYAVIAYFFLDKPAWLCGIIFAGGLLMIAVSRQLRK